MKKIFFIITNMICLAAFAQDVIIKNNKTEIKSKVLEISETEIKYKKWENQNGPTYTILKLETLMIIYQDGQREMMTNQPVQSNINTALVNNKPIVQTKETLVETPNNNYTFSARKKGIPKSKTNLADRFVNIGMPVNAFGKTLSILDDIYITSNIFYTLGTDITYTSQGGISSFGSSFVAGGTYYFNELLKLDKTKASVYAGALLAYTSVSTSGKVAGYDVSGTASSFGFGGIRAGGRYNTSKHFGVFCDVRFSDAGSSFSIGVSLINIK